MAVSARAIDDLEPALPLGPLPLPAGRRREVSAITVTYFTGPVLWDCIRSVLAQPELAQMVLVLNGVDSATRARLKEMAEAEPRLLLVDPGHNLGFAAGCNKGAAVATADFLALVNPDCELAPDTFGRILDEFAGRPQAWVMGGRLQFPDGREQRGSRRETLTPWRAFIELTRLDRLFPNHPYFARLNDHEAERVAETVQVPSVSGAFMVLPRDRYALLGGMDDNIFLHVDDADLCLRVLQNGGQVWYAGGVPINHHRGTSDVSRLFVEWHKTKSASYYFAKHFHASYPGWALTGLSLTLWLRFWLKALLLLPSEIPAMLRRARRRR